MMQRQNKARTIEVSRHPNMQATSNRKENKTKAKTKMDRIEVSGDNHGENIVLFNEILLLTRLIKSCYQNNLI